MDVEKKEVAIKLEDIIEMAPVELGSIDPETASKAEFSEARQWLNTKLEEGLLPCLECKQIWEPEKDSARMGDKCPDCRPDKTIPEEVELSALNLKRGLQLLRAGEGGIVIELDEKRPSVEKFQDYQDAVEFFQSCCYFHEKIEKHFEALSEVPDHSERMKEYDDPKQLDDLNDEKRERILEKWDELQAEAAGKEIAHLEMKLEKADTDGNE